MTNNTPPPTRQHQGKGKQVMECDLPINGETLPPSFAAVAHHNYVPGARAHHGSEGNQQQPSDGNNNAAVSDQDSQQLTDPYGTGLDLSHFPPILATTMKQILKQMRAPPLDLPPGRIIKPFKINAKRLGMRTMELHAVGAIIFTPIFNPDRERVYL
jgi:hypothetical protein